MPAIIVEYQPTEKKLGILGRIPIVRKVAIAFMTKFGGITKYPEGTPAAELEEKAETIEQISPDGKCRAVAKIQL